MFMRKQVQLIIKRNVESLVDNSASLTSAIAHLNTSMSLELKKPSEIKKTNDQYFVISEEFRIGLSKRLDPKNFKNIAFRQDELGNLIRLIDNPFQMLYLYEKNHRTFSTMNFVSFVKRIDILSRSGGVIIPQNIKILFAESMIKHSPHFLASDAVSTFFSLVSLGFSLNDHAIRAALQILKYHVNSFEINELIRLKSKLQGLKKESPANKFSQEFEKALGLVAQIKGGEITSAKNAVLLLKFYSDSISETNFTATLNFINSEWSTMRDRDIKDLARALLDRKYWHLLILRKLARFVVETNSDRLKVFKTEELEIFLKLFKEIKFYEKQASEILLNGLLSVAKELKENSEERTRIERDLLEYCQNLSKKDPKLLEFIKDNNLKFNDD